MGKYKKHLSSPEKQSLSAAKKIQRSGVKMSIRTLDNYRERLTQVARNLPIYGIKSEIHSLTKKTAITYLEIRNEFVGEETLKMEQKAIENLLRVHGRIKPNEKLPKIKPEIPQILKSRAYTPIQVKKIAQAQTEKYSLSTQIAYSAGLRAKELLTIRPTTERQEDKRDNQEREAYYYKFIGREGVRYTVQGKGSLIREVLIPYELAQQLEERRLKTPRTVIDRNINTLQYYDIGGGHNWSSSFASASKRVLGWSTGGHGVRHSYAQERLSEIQRYNTQEISLETVSQEMGHFRSEITKVYLR